jgi:hypothetical protein
MNTKTNTRPRRSCERAARKSDFGSQGTHRGNSAREHEPFAAALPYRRFFQSGAPKGGPRRRVGYTQEAPDMEMGIAVGGICQFRHCPQADDAAPERCLGWFCRSVKEISPRGARCVPNTGRGRPRVLDPQLRGTQLPVCHQKAWTRFGSGPLATVRFLHGQGPDRKRAGRSLDPRRSTHLRRRLRPGCQAKNTPSRHPLPRTSLAPSARDGRHARSDTHASSSLQEYGFRVCGVYSRGDGHFGEPRRAVPGCERSGVARLF